MPKALRTDLHKLASTTNVVVALLPIAFFAAGYFVSFYFHFLTVASFFLLIVNFFYRHVQKEHSILRNFGLLGQGRYLIESLGPEFRQYWFMGDREERPFNRLERAEVYRKAKNVDSVVSFGSLMEYDANEIKLRHSMFPTPVSRRKPYRLTVGEERGVKKPYVLTKPFMVSGMSYGALGSHAIRAIARGAAAAGIPMNCGEGGYPKYHFMEDADIIFQLGTAKFGVRNKDGDFEPEKLQEIAANPQVKMVEIKFSQGAKPGKGGMLPKEKISKEIAEMRGVKMGEDAISPPYHKECSDLPSTIAFIDRIQKLVDVPVGCKMCIGSLDEFKDFVQECIRQDVFPDWISVDGGEGGTGAAPKTFIDYVGMPLFPALHGVVKILVELGVRDRVKVFAAGKLINAARQSIAFALGADAIYSARGFMLALGCIQSRECGANTCPVGITTQNPKLQAGLVIEDKAKRVKHYIENTLHDLDEVVVAIGKSCPTELTVDDLFIPSVCNLYQMVENEPGLRKPLQDLRSNQ
ncbi:FMN-binding glutamate synthase family protein [Pelagicoccus sp. SDUM812003]|uniref:FMN-binding glutamate synthase family protein n=1 Tax=Pelagicoccus sp. SDUM812003 TaxID=3041267 RepID=UPI00280E440B|nr:FMN-binding glutamate synthase family protein [Pelagicoccus sp. SDUM812003]MDQ8205280.1 FMN-binding glutamate synthase family protein [Pelagicoccus sp. SDUM812003]